MKRFAASRYVTPKQDELTHDKLTKIVTNAIETKFFFTSSNTSNEDLNTLIVLIKSVSQKLTAFSDLTDITDKVSALSDLNMLINYIQLMLNGPIHRIDPVDKTKLKKRYFLEEADDLSELKRSYELQNEVYSGSTLTPHPHVAVLRNRIEEAEKKAAQYGNCVAVRPTELPYGLMISVSFVFMS